MSLHLDTGRAGDQPPAHGRAADFRPRGAPERIRGSRLTRLDIKYSPYLYILPFFLLFGAFTLYTLVYTFWVSLHNWDLIDGDKGYVGFKNYAAMLQDSWFWTAVRNTFGIFILSTVPQLLIALFLAFLLNKRMRFRTTIRMGILVPYVTSVAAVAIIFSQIFSRDAGLVNYGLHFFGVKAIDWRAHVWSSWAAIATMVNWRWIGYNTLIYLAAMQSISKDLYESASLDGASQFRQFRQITVPMLRPTIIFTVIVSIIGGMTLYAEPLLFNGSTTAIYGGTTRQSQTVTMYVIEQVFYRYHYGNGAAITWLLFLFILIISLIAVAFIGRSGGRKGAR
jgi:cellobiose transport system permease protein